MADNSPSLGGAVALTAILGDKLGSQVNRDQNLYYGRMAKLAEQKKDKLVTLKDFKFTGGLLPAYAGKEAQAYSDFANKFEADRAQYGDAAAVNKAYQDRQQFDLFVANNKAANDQTKWLIDQKNKGLEVPNYDKIISVVNNPSPTQADWQGLNDPIFGVSAEPKSGTILARPFVKQNFENAAEIYRKKQIPTNNITDGGLVGNDKIQFRQHINTPQDIQTMATQITHDPDNLLSFLSQNKDQLQTPEAKQKYGDVFSLDLPTRQAAQEKAAYDYATNLLRPTMVQEKGAVYHEPEGEKDSKFVGGGYHVEAAYPQATNIPAGSGTPLRPVEGKKTWGTYYNTRKPATVDISGSPAVIDAATGEAVTDGTWTGQVRNTGTMPLYDSKGKNITSYVPTVIVKATNQEQLDNYVSPQNQKALYDQSLAEASKNLPKGLSGKALEAAQNEVLAKADDIFDEKLHKPVTEGGAGLPKAIKVNRTLQVPASEVPAALGSHLKTLMNDATVLNSKLGKSSSKAPSTGKKKIPGF